MHGDAILIRPNALIIWTFLMFISKQKAIPWQTGDDNDADANDKDEA